MKQLWLADEATCQWSKVDGAGVDWCETHLESAWSPYECWKQVYGEGHHFVEADSLCRIVRMRIVEG